MNIIDHPVFATTTLAAVCGYGGTFFFTVHNPIHGALYLGSVALTSHVAYLILDEIKAHVKSPKLTHVFSAIQLFQIPLVFYYPPSSIALNMPGNIKLEIIIAAIHFLAIPLVFHLGIETWKDPTLINIGYTGSLMLTLANGLRNYIQI